MTISLWALAANNKSAVNIPVEQPQMMAVAGTRPHLRLLEVAGTAPSGCGMLGGVERND